MPITRTNAISLASLSLLICSTGGLLHLQAAKLDPGQNISITVCAEGSGNAGPSCPAGTYDTHEIVLGPNGQVINSNGPSAAIDEHASVLPPGSVPGIWDYLFFLATGTSVNPDVGLTVLASPGPDWVGQWTLNFTDSYGSYPVGFGTVFLAPTAQSHCPDVADKKPADQDPTFDLTYAAPGSVVPIPAIPSPLFLMVYEGVNTCIGTTGGLKPGGGDSYSSVSVATSLDYGQTWPTYRGTPTFTFVDLPMANKTQGPGAPSGAFGAAVCFGNNCASTPPDNYGRYPVLSPSVSLTTEIEAGTKLTSAMGDSEPSAFVDDIGPEKAPWTPFPRYLYEVHRGLQTLPDGRTGDLMMARANLSGGSSPLLFSKWDGVDFSSPGVGGAEAPILPDGAFANCADTSQQRSQGSLSFFQQEHLYLLIFVCSSPGDPANGVGGGSFGSAWFFSTSNDLSDPTQWSTPQEISGSWMTWDTGPPAMPYGCPSYKGWYPTFMSLGRPPGHLSNEGYVFYLWGCLGAGNPGATPERQFSSRRFFITHH